MSNKTLGIVLIVVGVVMADENILAFRHGACSGFSGCWQKQQSHRVPFVDDTTIGILLKNEIRCTSHSLLPWVCPARPPRSGLSSTFAAGLKP